MDDTDNRNVGPEPDDTPPTTGGTGNRWLDEIDAILAAGDKDDDLGTPASSIPASRPWTPGSAASASPASGLPVPAGQGRAGVSAGLGSPYPGAASAPAKPSLTSILNGPILLAACEATAALTRLDERLAAAAPHVQKGWLERWAQRTTVASMALDGRSVDPDDLLLDSANALARGADEDLRAVRETLDLSRRASRRATKHLFQPRRLAALARPRGAVVERRLQRRLDAFAAAAMDGASEGLLEILGRDVDPTVARQRLADALAPDMLWDLEMLPPVVGAAMFLAHWHATAAPAVGAAPGRILADAWLRHTGLTRRPIAGIAVGFGRLERQDYEPTHTERWVVAFLHATRRSAEAGLGLLRSIEGAERAILVRQAREMEKALESGTRTRAGRSDSVFEALVRVLVERPAASLPQIQAVLATTRPRYRRRAEGEEEVITDPWVEDAPAPPRKRAGDEVVRRHVTTLEARGQVIQMRERLEDNQRIVMRIYRLAGC